MGGLRSNLNEERNALIVAKRDAGMWPTDIAAEMGLSRNTVIGVCNRAGRCSPDNAGKNSRAPKGEAHGRAVLNEGDVRAIRAMRWKTPKTLDQIAEIFGVSSSTVNAISTGQSWRHLPDEIVA